MKKKILWILALCFCVIFLTACDITINVPPEPTEPQTTVQVSSNPVVETPSNSEEEIKMTEIKVSSARDLYLNIKPNTRIILTENYYNISYIDASTFSSDYVEVDNSFDGYEFIIHDVENLEIVADANVFPEFVTEGAHVNVISLRDCTNVTIDGLIVGHEVEKGSCTGGVIKLMNCNIVAINHCGLYGCGTYGITTEDTNNVTVNNTEIYECSYGLLELVRSNYFNFNNCTFRDSGVYSMLCFRECNNISFENCTFRGNKSGAYSSFIENSTSPTITFTKCVFKDNTYDSLWSGEEPAFIGCKAEDPNFGQEYYYDVEPDYDE